ncbi:hypothetical protein, partial [Curtobacterium sp. C2H10]|uniref:hypothetical protein n=1 Tax=Curtobacterium sp. C2H10 TaxID=2736664 RepID=UPI0021BE0166
PDGAGAPDTAIEPGSASAADAAGEPGTASAPDLAAATQAAATRSGGPARLPEVTDDGPHLPA